MGIDRECILVLVDANCTDNHLGSLLGAYLAQDLTFSQREEFEKHRGNCVSCDTTVLNWLNLQDIHKQPAD